MEHQTSLVACSLRCHHAMVSTFVIPFMSGYDDAKLSRRMQSGAPVSIDHV